MPTSARTQALLATIRRGRCLHRPAPPHFLQKTVIAKPVRTLAVAIRIPRPHAPLPKGGWHGKAETGGFLSRTHGRAHGPCFAKCFCRAEPMCPAAHRTLFRLGAGRCGHAALRNPIGKHFVGDDAHIVPSYRISYTASLPDRPAGWLWQSVNPVFKKAFTFFFCMLSPHERRPAICCAKYGKFLSAASAR